MSLFGRKTEKHNEVLDEIRKSVEEDKNIPQQPPEIQDSPLNRLFEGRPMEPKFRSQPEKIHARETDIPKIDGGERPSFAPLFIKIDRYRQILSAVGHLKTTMIMIKNSLITLNELDKARDETFKLVQDAIEKLEGRLDSLDQELVRPSGFQDRVPTTTHDVIEKPQYQDVETIEATIADLKGQIEQLKSELDSVC
jgi:hypothetical protein